MLILFHSACHRQPQLCSIATGWWSQTQTYFHKWYFKSVADFLVSIILGLSRAPGELCQPGQTERRCFEFPNDITMSRREFILLIILLKSYLLAVEDERIEPVCCYHPSRAVRSQSDCAAPRPRWGHRGCEGPRGGYGRVTASFTAALAGDSVSFPAGNARNFPFPFPFAVPLASRVRVRSRGPFSPWPPRGSLGPAKRAGLAASRELSPA